MQRVLDVKTKEEQRKRIELLKLTEKLAETQGELLIRKRILEDVIADITRKNPGERLGEQEFFLKYAATNDEQIKKLKNRVSKLESQQREKIIEVLRIRRFKEGLEKLRDEAKRQFIKEQEKLEQKESDEQAGISFVLKRNPT